jgi:crotonobetaine/carnitine-CoA ligase
LKGAFLEHQLRVTQPRVLFVDAALRQAFETVELAGIDVEATVSIGGVAPALPGTQNHRFEDLSATTARPQDCLEATPYTVCTIMFTSGTTGPAKGVMMPHGHCFYNGLIAMRRTRLTAADIMYISMPLFHGTASLLQLYASLQAGASAYIVRRFSASAWLSDVRVSQATVTYAAGVMAEFILKQPERDDDADNSLRLVWSVPVSKVWGRSFEVRFGVRILQAYGMTELCVPVWGDLDEPLEPGCAGEVVRDFWDVRIVDPETDEALGTDEVGEIVGRPKEPGVFMAGYFGMPEKTVEAWRTLWFHTGDAGYFDHRGRLFYVDRIRDRIRRRGENISAFEVEGVLGSHPGVRQCAVIGVKVPGAGGEDEVMAYVVPHSPGLSEVELLDWCVPRMPRYAVPRFIALVDFIEQTPTGKVRKQELRERGVKPNVWDRESVGYVVPR